MLPEVFSAGYLRCWLESYGKFMPISRNFLFCLCENKKNLFGKGALLAALCVLLFPDQICFAIRGSKESFLNRFFVRKNNLYRTGIRNS